ncbi:MAG: hypothetical protein CVT74_02040, partial [Alphaproteobacteria bacterium HGW-Alphaproteobacteria-13]
MVPAAQAQTTAGNAPAAAAKPAAAAASTYRINAGDELEIYVWGEERLQRQVKVLPDGTIAFPLVGQIKVQGYLPAEVEGLITSGLSAQYVGAVPQVMPAPDADPAVKCPRRPPTRHRCRVTPASPSAGST